MDSHDGLDPWPDDDPSDLTFDPNRPRFADVPLVKVSGGQLEVVRGHLPSGVDLQQWHDARTLPDGTLLGVFSEHEVYEVGEEMAGDPRIHRRVHAPRARILAGDLPAAAKAVRELAQELTEYAGQLEQLQEQGWRLIDIDGLDMVLVDMEYRSRIT